MEFTLKKYPCSLCSKDEARLLLMKQEFSIVKCSNCGFVYVNPRLDNTALASLYRHNYFANKDYGYQSYEQEKRLRVKNFRRWLKDASRFIDTSSTVSTLDVGCAAGYCLELMLENGWNPYGLELDEKMYTDLQGRGFKVYRSLLKDFNTEERFSVITLFDVIEHIPDIDEAFTKLNSLLVKDGIIILVTPNHNSFQRKLLGKKWFQYKPIEHIQYFDRRSLAAFAERNGLEIILCNSCGQYADSHFLLNRLNYYRFNFFASLISKIFSVLRLNEKCIYTDTGSLFVILKKK